MHKHDVVVVGAGSGGLAAAHMAKFRGASVCIIEDGPIGGDCTWTGCVPSKALLAAAARGETFDEAMSSVSAAVVEVGGAETADVLRSHGFSVVEARGTLIGNGRVDVGDAVVVGRHLVVAPGSRPAIPPISGLEGVPYLTNEDVWNLASLPKSLTIIGGGPIGCEMAQAFASLGAEVTVIEGEDRLLIRDDADASTVARRTLTEAGVVVMTGAFVEEATRRDACIAVKVGGSVVESEALLVATGRAPAHDSMGLEEVGVSMTAAGWIDVDAQMRTTAKNVWAVGDAVGSTQFTHAAAHMARVAIDNALGIGIAKLRKLRFDPAEIPWVTFMTPEVAQIGATEAEAVGIKGARVAELPYSAIDRAVAARRPEGFIKLIAVPRPIVGFAGGGRLIGATIVGGGAGELISEVALAIRTKVFAGRLAQTVHPYPSWSFGLAMTAGQFLGTVDGRTSRAPGSERGASL